MSCLLTCLSLVYSIGMLAKLTVACGPMFSGKTEELLRRVRRTFYADLGVQIFTPSTDTRHLDRFVSHAGTDLAALQVPFVPSVIRPDEPFAHRVRANVDLVALDEAQFFAPSVVDEILHLIHVRKMSVFAAGLDRDYLGRPFGPMPALLAHADEVLKFTAVCARCRQLDAATMTHRINGGAEQIQIGGQADYEPLCRSCWVDATRTAR